MIGDIEELNFPKKDGKQYATLTHATATLADMGEKTITTQVKIDGEIVPDFSFDWEVEFQGEKYIMPLRIPQGAKENTSLNSTIDLTFQHWAIYQLKRWPFVTIQQIAAGTYMADEEVAPVQLNLKDFCILFGQVLEYYYGDTITIDLNDDPVTGWQYKQEATRIEISHTKIWNVLIDAFHSKYGVRWEIKAASGNSNTVKGGERYVIRVGYPTTEVDHIFEYGFEGGLLKVERQVQSEEIRNMLKGRGGDTNIPFRYFKDTDPNNKDFRPDPDWVEELANIPFKNLMPATFRSYVQGWKAAHISKYPGYTAVGESNAYAPWAYRKGYTDTKFAPVEFVADEITINPTTGDKQVEILPGYSPYVKKGSSIDKYGPLPDTLDNNDDIYPTLQGTGLDIAVAVEQIQNDDIEGTTEAEALISNLEKVNETRVLKGKERATVTLRGCEFTVGNGKTAEFVAAGTIVKYGEKSKIDKGEREGNVAVITDSDLSSAADVWAESIGEWVCVASTGERRSASGIPPGTYYFEVDVTVYNTTDKDMVAVVACEQPKLLDVTDVRKWTNTFDIWVKNIWDSSKLPTESPTQYAERVWRPVLGDREGKEAAVMFTSGDLVHEDYEFKIPKGAWPVYDTNQEWTDSNGVAHTSHWRIKLAKSEAELEATGLYVPSKQKQGKAGDRFVFIGTEMTHVPYVVDAEKRLDGWKKDQLGEKKEIKPTAVVTTDRVRLNNEGKPDALINQLRVGNSVRLFDKRFFNEEGEAYETLYLQSITYTYREPSSDDAALNPDVEIVLGSEYTTSANPVSMMQGEISALQRQVGSISNVEQIVRAVGDRQYLRKDGISDRSLSPTQFFSLLTSGDFRAGLIGGAGWGFFKDENGNWVLETDRVNVRQDMSLNTLVINQAEGRGGVEVDTAALMKVTRVIEVPDGYVCYFDQRDGSVANMFQEGDVAYCNRWTPENAALKAYRRRVTETGADYVKLTKPRNGTDRPTGWPDSGVNGMGIPSEGDNVIHFGSYTDAERRYVKVRDVVGGGYERYIENLDSVNAEGTEYYFVGRQTGMYNGRPRFYIGDGNSYMEYADGELNFKGKINTLSTIGGKAIPEYVKENMNLEIGGENLLLNTNQGTRGWSWSYSADGEFTVGQDTASKVGIMVTNKSATASPQWQQLRFKLNSSVIKKGEYMLTFGGKMSGAPVVLRCGIQNGTGSSVLSNINTVGLTTRVSRHAVAIKVTDLPLLGMDYYVSFYVSSEAVWSSFDLLDLKLERGTVATDWSAAPQDVDYLKRALLESGGIEGGLVLGSYMQLGHTDGDGVYRVMSGMNGIYDGTRESGGTALWAGGDNSDLGDEHRDTTLRPARFLIRMNGTGYAAEKAIEFNDDHLKVGKDVMLSKRGLILLDDNLNERVVISNDSLPGDIADSFQSNIAINSGEIEESVTIASYTPALSEVPVAASNGLGEADLNPGNTVIAPDYPGWTPATNWLVVKNGFSRIVWSGRIPGQSRVNFTGRVAIHTGNTTTLRGKVVVQLLSGSTVLAKKEGAFSLDGTLGKWTCEIGFNDIRIAEEGNYSINIEVPGANAGTTIGSRSATVGVKGAANMPLSSKTLLMSDGFATLWGTAVVVAKEDDIILRVGDNGIRINNSGIYRLKAGSQWSEWS